MNVNPDLPPSNSLMPRAVFYYNGNTVGLSELTDEMGKATETLKTLATGELGPDPRPITISHQVIHQPVLTPTTPSLWRKLLGDKPATAVTGTNITVTAMAIYEAQF